MTELINAESSPALLPKSNSIADAFSAILQIIGSITGNFCGGVVGG